jgi:hypothetical protein
MYNRKFKTFTGGIISIIIFVAVLCVFGVKMKTMYLMEGTVIKKNTIVSASNKMTPELDLMSYGMSFAFILTDFYASTVMD